MKNKFSIGQSISFLCRGYIIKGNVKSFSVCNILNSFIYEVELLESFKNKYIKLTGHSECSIYEDTIILEEVFVKVSESDNYFIGDIMVAIKEVKEVENNKNPKLTYTKEKIYLR